LELLEVIAQIQGLKLLEVKGRNKDLVLGLAQTLLESLVLQQWE
jgi:hypothetical protein